MILAEARAIAEEIVRKLAPHCYRCEIAGSIRREKPDVHDIEIVCSPRSGKPLQMELFEESCLLSLMKMQVHCDDFADAVRSLGMVKAGKPNTGKYIKVDRGVICIDLFCADVGNYGLIKFIRTGSAEYVKNVFGHLLPGAPVSRGGWLYRSDGRPINTPDELDVFRALYLRWQEPKEREV